MNLREGMRRVGMVLGLIGFCVGSFVAYDYVNKLLGQATEAREYQTQHELPPGAKVVRIPETRPKSAGAAPTVDYAALAEQVRKQSAGAAPTVEIPDFDSYVPPRDQQDNTNPAKLLMDGVEANKLADRSAWRPLDEFDQYIQKPQPGAETPKAPSFWQYLPALAFPLLGFLMPWGAIKALTWIGTGFVTSIAK